MNYRFSIGAMSLNQKQLYPETELVLPEQGVTLIIGKNGCGKTTLMNHIIYQNPDAITLIAQENDLIFSELSVADNLMLFHKDETRLLELLELFQLRYILERKPQHLSGGEKRLVSLLRLFFVENALVFLDEPTNDLDYRAVETVKTMIAELALEKSLLIVTHDERLFPLADRTYQFRDGKLFPDQTVDTDYEITVPQRSISDPRPEKLLRRDVVGILLYALIILSSVCAGLAALLTNTPKPEVFRENQTNIASKLYYNPMTMIAQGYLPLEAYKQYRGSVDLDFLKLYGQSLQESLSSGGSLGMILNEDLGRIVLPCICMNVVNGEQSIITRLYQAVHSQSSDMTAESLERISVYDGIVALAEPSEDGVSIPIDYRAYQEIARSYMEEGAAEQPILYTVLDLDETKLTEVNGNYFIKNNTTNRISQDIASLQSLLDSIELLGIALAGSVLFYYLYFFISLKLLQNYITLMRNLAVPQNVLQRAMLQKRIMPLWKLLIAAAGAAVCSYMCLVVPEQTVLFAAVALTCVGTGISVILSSYAFLRYRLRRIYHFEGIYEV
ncbi:MAG: ATP-binding cassette domain-containing protein [Oscillospiraceae bacterium]|nr:ATP-binding cassette domain-containing protein [Oscillospiraceae bacterium]